MGSVSTSLVTTVVAAIAFVLLIDSAVAQLSREEKQLFLDSHNYRRASVGAADMNQIVSDIYYIYCMLWLSREFNIILYSAMQSCMQC